MDSELLQTPTLQSHLEQVAAALAPLRASSSRSALANAVGRLVTNATVACRVDVLHVAEGGGPANSWQLDTLSRTVRPERSEFTDPALDLGSEEALAGKAAVLPDPARGACWVVIPLVARRSTSGALRVVLDGPTIPSASDLAHLHHIASSLAMGLSSAELHEQSERVSRRLQESLLPKELPAANWFQVAARYVPATAGMYVGGDWYDAQLISAGELAFSVGDVAGHGVEAAARMGELRSAIHAFRLLSHAPDQLITSLHRMCDPLGYFATAICARLDPSGNFRWASAGHLPPMVAHPSGKVVRLTGHQSPPLGAGVEGAVVLDQRVLSPGDVVLLYTDGLIERRGEPLDLSLDRLVSQLSAALGSTRKSNPDELLDALLARRQPAGPTRDDIALIAVRVGEPG